MYIMENSTKHIRRSHDKPIRENLSWDEQWKAADKGLIGCWETGRKLVRTHPELAEKAKNSELPALNWKGGSDTKYCKPDYLARWQGLRGEPMDIDATSERELVCSQTGVAVVFAVGADARYDRRQLQNEWQIGKELAEKSPQLAERAKRGELLVLPKPGSTAGNLSIGESIRYGSLFYLAQWQGLRGEDLNIDTSVAREVVCSRTGMTTIFAGAAEGFEMRRKELEKHRKPA